MDLPRLLSISESPAGSGSFALVWQVVAGRTYRFQLKGNLSDTDWTTVGEDYTAESSTVEVTDEAGTNHHGFYRVLDVTAP